MGTQTASMLVSIALAVLALSGEAEVWHAYALAALGGTALVFDAPGRHALTFQMVGRDELSNAVALNASLFNASRVVGPAAAGVIIAAVGVGACFALNALSFLAVLTSLALMRKRELQPVERGASSRRGSCRAFAKARLRGADEPDPRRGAHDAHREHGRLQLPCPRPVLAADTLHAGPEGFGLLSATASAPARSSARC